ncbi:MAG: 4-hydroxy-3-methylbut-2-enyl diphosphate reductase, partial [Clostridiales bacterium]|nr:4-hydroxy-3-methylbut-2-enyl diphosphate reductase [Clostridiales bacterium]
MELILAKTAGFCFGVKRAVDCVYKEAEAGKIYTFGPIIHNKTVTEALEKKGVRAIDNFENITDGKIILRSHGVSPKIYQTLTEKGLRFTDCTCPYVKKIHQIVAAEAAAGNKIIIIGNVSHPEIQGIRGWAGDNAIIFGSAKEVDDFPLDLSYNYSVVVQTTFQREYFNAIIDRITAKGVHFHVFNTICAATAQRQDEAERLSKIVDKMIVIGDKSSSNAKQLYEICSRNCNKTFFIETNLDLQLNIFSTNDKIGITAGASTP